VLDCSDISCILLSLVRPDCGLAQVVISLMASLRYEEKDENKADGAEDGQDPAEPLPAKALETRQSKYSEHREVHTRNNKSRNQRTNRVTGCKKDDVHHHLMTSFMQEEQVLFGHGQMIHSRQPIREYRHSQKQQTMPR
jgi:hypothetical protein